MLSNIYDNSELHLSDCRQLLDMLSTVLAVELKKKLSGVLSCTFVNILCSRCRLSHMYINCLSLFIEKKLCCICFNK